MSQFPEKSALCGKEMLGPDVVQIPLEVLAFQLPSQLFPFTDILSDRRFSCVLIYFEVEITANKLIRPRIIEYIFFGVWKSNSFQFI